ncbi:MAG: ribose-phosphate pyrophosphokinase [wastewater metagenome]|nr:ribose-phosphate pyrophosphokinase [Candidatus Loosdrechtia aerotolerans]
MSQEHCINQQIFFTPERFAQEQVQKMEPPRGRLLFAGCRSSTYLLTRIVNRYKELLVKGGSKNDILHLENIDKQFSDTETCVRLDTHVSGYDVFLFQALFDPIASRSVDQNYMTLLIAARTFREHGANHITAVLPYLAYARQDKPTRFKREPTTARLMADLSIEAGIDRLITWAPHSNQTHGFYANISTNLLDALPLFIEEYRRFQDHDDVIAVAPDAGISKFVGHFGRVLNLKCAIGSKYRPRPEEAEISEVIGDFTGKTTAIVLDDMISSGGTVYAIIKKLVEEKGIQDVYLGISHNLCNERAYNYLKDLHKNYHLKEMIVTNSIPQTDEFQSLPFVSVKCLSDILCRTINRVHFNRSVNELLYRPLISYLND